MWSSAIWIGPNLPRGEWIRGDVAVLASKIADLAGLRLSRVARGDLATDVWILVS